MKKIFIINCLLILFVLQSCTKDFAELNTNPNTTAAATPETLIAPALLAMVNANSNRSMRLNDELVQVLVTTSDSREFHRYIIRPSESDYMWRNWYLQLTNFRNIYTSAEQTQQTGYQTFMGLSLILDVWASSLVTDTYGDVPYFESNLGKEGIVQPKFDKQKDIYLDFFKKLEKANTLLTNNVDFPIAQQSLDPLYSGKAANWRKFGNTLYLRLLMRVSGKNEPEVLNKIKEIAETKKSTYPTFASNADNAILPVGSTLPLLSEFANYRDLDFSGGKGYTEFFINNLNAWIDPRLTVWATTMGLGGGYMGMPSGYVKGGVPEANSTLLLTLKTDKRLGNIINYAELQFILAEATLKGYITGDVKSLYDNGVQNAITMWDVAVPAGHLDKEDVKWNATNTQEQAMEQIHLQKYYTMFLTDFQQWFEVRRTGHPVLPIGPGIAPGVKMPERFRYPVNTQSTNPVNYRNAVNGIGGEDSQDVKVWWNTPN